MEIATCNKLLENMAKFEHFATALTYHSDVQEYVNSAVLSVG
jgi:hypothetical protein